MKNLNLSNFQKFREVNHFITEQNFFDWLFIWIKRQHKYIEDDKDDDRDNRKKGYGNLCKQIGKLLAINLATIAVLGGAGVGIGYAIQAACK